MCSQSISVFGQCTIVSGACAALSIVDAEKESVSNKCAVKSQAKPNLTANVMQLHGVRWVTIGNIIENIDIVRSSISGQSHASVSIQHAVLLCAYDGAHVFTLAICYFTYRMHINSINVSR